MIRGLLGTRATLVADINLMLQVVILTVLLIGILRSRGREFGTVRAWISLAVVLNAVLIIAIMNPSFFRILPFALRNPSAPVPILLWPHVAAGLIAELIGVYMALATNLNWESRMGPGRRRLGALLGALLLLWALALVVGLLIYTTRYM